MPRTPVDYSKTIIYKLVHKEDFNNENIYIGFTTDFTRRKTSHRNSCNNEKNKNHNEKKYQYIRGNGGWNEWNMVLIERHNCNDGNEARAREEYWRCQFNAQLNTFRASRTDEQDKEIRKEYQKEYSKEHYEQNKNKLLDYVKEYYEANKEKRLDYAKEYREQNKDNILEQQKQQITCECGCIITKTHLTRHHKSQKHLLLTNQIKYEFVDDNGEN